MNMENKEGGALTRLQAWAESAGVGDSMTWVGKNYSLAQAKTDAVEALRFISDAVRERDDLAAKVYVPGLWRCAKCKLYLTASLLCASTGAIAADAKPQGCPNGCGPMWRVTEREERRDAQRSFNDLFDKERASVSYAEQCLGLLRRIVAGWHQSGTAEVWAADALQEAADLVEQERKRRAALAKNLNPGGQTGQPQGDSEGQPPQPVGVGTDVVLTGRRHPCISRWRCEKTGSPVPCDDCPHPLAREALGETVLQMGRSRGAEDIAAERARQMSVEGWTPSHDDAHGPGVMAQAAVAYTIIATEPRDPENAKVWWPWDWSWWKPRDPRRNLVRAGALIAAEIDRLDRAAKTVHETGSAR